MARAKKKHVCSCGEEFNHGIGLRKHQRQTGHKGSSIVDDEGGDEEGAEAEKPEAPPPPPPPPTPTPPVASPPPPAPPAPAPKAEAPAAKIEAPTPSPPAPPSRVADDDDEPEHTVAVVRETFKAPETPTQGQDDWGYDEPSRFAHNRQKLTLVSSGLKVIAKSRAREAGHQLKQSARSGADIFAEAAKIAVALLLLIAIPSGVFWWWWKQRKAPPPPVDVPNSFTVEGGALAARNTLLLYLDSLKKERWDDAYGRLSESWQSELTSSGFQESLAGIENIRWAVNDQKLMADGSAEVSLVLAFTEDGRAKKYQGRFRLVQDKDTWRVDRAELSPSRS